MRKSETSENDRRVSLVETGTEESAGVLLVAFGIPSFCKQFQTLKKSSKKYK